MAPTPLPPVAATDTADAIDKEAAEAWVGQMLAGKYRVDKVLGRGGMGVVLRASHRSLGEPVALKVLRPSMLALPGMVTRFNREARAASKIKSDHVVRVTDVDTLESGVPYMIMEYLDGTDLAAVLREQGRLPIEVAVRHVIEACDALAEAHANGVVHRDIKPANLFLARRRDGREIIKVLDFGISKIEEPDEQQDPTRTGTMMGSPKFMAPEQMRSMHDVDGRADIWALGAILYALLTGKVPFAAESTPQICALVLTADPDPPRALRPEIPAELEAIVLRCLQKNPALRFQTATELRRALAPFASAAIDAGMELERSKETARASAPQKAASPSTEAPSQSHGHATAMVSLIDTEEILMAKRRSSGVLLAGIGLALAAGIALLLFAGQREPASVDAAQTTTAPALGGPVLPPSVLPPLVPPPPMPPPTTPSPPEPAAATVTVTPTPALASAPAPTQAADTPPPRASASAGLHPAGAKRPAAPTTAPRAPSGAADPFGGSRH